jgi:hypothetical protein
MKNAKIDILGNSMQADQIPNANYWGFLAYSTLFTLLIGAILITAIIVAPTLGISAAVGVITTLLIRRKLGSHKENKATDP